MPGQGIGISKRVAQTTIAKWGQLVSEQTEQRYVLLAMMKKKGRIVHGCHGGEYRWVVRYRDHPIKGFIDMDPIDYVRENTKVNANLPWRSYRVTDVISEREKLENGGAQAMISIFKNREEVMRRGAIRQLAGEFFKDGNLAANSADDKWHGIESFMSIGSQTAADLLATTHDDTYAGNSTAVAGLGADAESARVWTPVVVNCDRTPSGGTQRDWADYADEYLRKGFLEASYGAGPEDNIDVALLTKTAFEALLNILDDKERIQVRRGGEAAVVKLGFDKFVEVDGVSVGWDAGVPSSDGTTADGGSNSDNSGAGVTVHGYGFNTSRMKLMCMGPKGSKGIWRARTTFNDDYQADRIFMSHVGNLCFESPRHFVKFADISS